MVEWKKRIMTGVIVLPILYFIIRSKFCIMALFIPLFYVAQKEYLGLIRHILLKLYPQVNTNAYNYELNHQINVYLMKIDESKAQYIIPLLYFVMLYFSESTNFNFQIFSLLFVMLGLILYRIIQYVKYSDDDKYQKDKLSQSNQLLNETIHINKYVATFVHIASEIICIVLFVFPFGYALVASNYANNGYQFIILWLVIAFQSDNGALFGGKLFGKHLFCPKVSPSKTWEGVAGAVVLGTISSLLWGMLQYVTEIAPALPMFDYFFLGLIGSSSALLGDFVESFIKRSAGVKDSGDFFPGHGGMLDRLDSLGFCAPFYFTYVFLYLNSYLN